MKNLTSTLLYKEEIKKIVLQYLTLDSDNLHDAERYLKKSLRMWPSDCESLALMVAVQCYLGDRVQAHQYYADFLTLTKCIKCLNNKADIRSKYISDGLYFLWQWEIAKNAQLDGRVLLAGLSAIYFFWKAIMD